MRGEGSVIMIRENPEKEEEEKVNPASRGTETSAVIK